MPDQQHDMELPGCTPEPLMAYLKALGILRLVSEQADPDARGWWQNDTFWLRSTLDRDALVKFFLEEYRPTPIVAPWGARSGFYPGSNEKSARTAICKIEQSADDRLRPFSQLIADVRHLLDELQLQDKPETDQAKLVLMRACRAHLSDDVLGWIDSCYVLTNDTRRFPPLLGTGGNEGSGSYVSGFAQATVDCLIDRKHDNMLGVALFPRALGNVFVDQTPGHFSPSSSGGANATQGLEGAVQTNLWEYILCLEGCCVWCSGPSKRFASASRGHSAYPFTFEVTGAGAPSLADADAHKPKKAKRDVAEMWLPLWDRPLTLGGLQAVLIEGRAEHRGRKASSGLDMTRAVAALGVDRGFTSFSRHVFEMRNGQSFMAIPQGRHVVRHRTDVDLLREVDLWLDQFRLAVETSAKSIEKRPQRFASALRAIDSAIFDFCRYGGKPLFQKILIALGQAERELALTPGKVGQSRFPPGPLAGLSRDWIDAADDGSREFAVARALAGVRHEPDNPGEHPKVGPLRANLEPIDWENKRCRAWAERDRAVIWNAADLPTNLAAALARRIMDGDRAGCENLPLASPARAPLSTISAFIAGETDDPRIEDLLRGLVLVNPSRHEPNGGDDAGIPAAYALLKLLLLPRPLVIEPRDDGRVVVRYSRPDENGIRIRPEPRVLHLLRAGRLGEACAIAMRRLRASGLAPMPRARAGRTRDGDWEELDRLGAAGLDPARLAAALLIPISDRAVSRLVTLITRPEDIDAGPDTEPEPAGSLAAGD